MGVMRVVVTFVVGFPLVAAGGTSSPDSSVVVSGDGRRVLVMVSPEPTYDRARTAVLPGGRVVDVHDTFCASGVYDASTLEPVWQVDWFSLRGDVRCSSDLRHVVRWNRRGFRGPWGLAFYEDGRPVRTYACGELLTGMGSEWFLPYSTWDWHTRWYEDFDVSKDGRRVELSTVRRRTCLFGRQVDLGRQEFYAFELAGGAMVERRVAGAWRVWAYGAGAATILVTAALVVRAVWRLIRSSVGRRRRGFEVCLSGGGS